MGGLFQTKPQSVPTTTTQNTTQTSQLSPQALALLGQVQGYLGNIPTEYTLGAQPVAGLTEDQLAAFQGVRGSQGVAAPYFQQALTSAQQAGTPINVGDVNDLYTQMYPGALAPLREQQAIERRNVMADATQAAGGQSAGRLALTGSNLARQQDIATAGAASNLWQQALNAALQGKQQQASAAALQGNLAQGYQGAGYTDIAQLLGIGGMQQQQQQAELMAPWQREQQAFMYPYMPLQAALGVFGAAAPYGQTTTGTGTGTQTTTYPAPSLFSQIAGPITAGIGMGLNYFNPFGQRTAAEGGRVDGGDNNEDTPYHFDTLEPGYWYPHPGSMDIDKWHEWIRNFRRDQDLQLKGIDPEQQRETPNYEMWPGNRALASAGGPFYQEGGEVGDPLPLDAKYLDLIKKFEGFTPTPTWDVNAYRSGYGTEASSPYERIDEAEGTRRLIGKLGPAAQYVDTLAPNAPPGARAALTSLRFNAGNFGPDLRSAIGSGDWGRVADIVQQYNHSQGRVLPGLTRRRAVESALIRGEDPETALGFAETPYTGGVPSDHALRFMQASEQRSQGLPHDTGILAEGRGDQNPYRRNLGDMLMYMGLGMMGSAGERDRFGLPVPPLASIGKGAMAGLGMMNEREKIEQAERLRLAQLAETGELRRAQMEQTAAIAAGNLEARRDALKLQEAEKRYLYGPEFGSDSVKEGSSKPLEMDANEAAQTGQPFDYSRGVLKVEKNNPLPEPRSEVGPQGIVISPDTFKTDAYTWLMTGKLPPPPAASYKDLRSKRWLQEYQAAIMNYGAAKRKQLGLSEDDLTELRAGFKGYSRWAFGPGGNQTVSMANVVKHANYLTELANKWDEALKSVGGSPNDTELFRRIAAPIAKKYGMPEPTNVSFAGGILGDEVTKAIVPTAGSEMERRIRQEFFQPWTGPQQLRGAAETAKAMIGEQFLAKRAQASAAHAEKLFDKILGPEALKVYREQAERSEQRGAAPGANIQLKTPNADTLAAARAAISSGKKTRAEVEAIMRAKGFSPAGI